MKTFFRYQGKGISFEDMQAYHSTDVDGTQYDGLCCADSASALRIYIEPMIGFGDDDDNEVIIFRGQKSGEIYDGVVAKPVEEIARASISDFMDNDDWCDLEN